MTFQRRIFLLILSSIHVHAAVSSTTVLDGLEFEGGQGNIRFHYDDSTETSCETVILLGVGTGMAVGGYDKLSSQVVADSSHCVHHYRSLPWESDQARAEDDICKTRGSGC
jgi:hypothetical protein